MPMHTSISMDNEYLTRDKRGRKHNKGCTCMYIHYPLFIVHVHVHVHGYAYIHGHMHVHMHVKCEYTNVYAYVNSNGQWTFDEIQKRKETGQRVYMCLHPSSIVHCKFTCSWVWVYSCACACACACAGACGMWIYPCLCICPFQWTMNIWQEIKEEGNITKSVHVCTSIIHCSLYMYMYMGMRIFMGICMCMCMWNVHIPMPMPTSIPMDNEHLTRDKRGRTKNKGQWQPW